MSRFWRSVARIEAPGAEIRDRRSRISHSPSKTGVNALMGSIQATAFALACANAAALAQPAPPPQRPAPAPPAPQQKLTIGFVDVEGDPRYAPIEGSDRI